MPLDAGAIDDAIELGSLALPAIEGKAWFLEFPGVRARETAISHPFMNLVAMTRLADGDAEATIDAVALHFAARDKELGWMLGPRSRPRDLRLRLSRVGFDAVEEIDGLACTDLGLPIPMPSDVEVREAGAEDRPAFDAVKAAAFDLPIAAAAWIDELLFACPKERVRTVLAYVGDRPVGFAQTFWHGEIAILGGAGVLPAYRGRGVFRALVAQRLRDAREHGLRAATIQAYQRTSSPILTRLGFQKRGVLAHLAR
jgi:GNAT superfamily N-acetyltransferase